MKGPRRKKAFKTDVLTSLEELLQRNRRERPRERDLIQLLSAVSERFRSGSPLVRSGQINDPPDIKKAAKQLVAMQDKLAEAKLKGWHDGLPDDPRLSPLRAVHLVEGYELATLVAWSVLDLDIKREYADLTSQARLQLRRGYKSGWAGEVVMSWVNRLSDFPGYAQPIMLENGFGVPLLGPKWSDALDPLKAAFALHAQTAERISAGELVGKDLHIALCGRNLRMVYFPWCLFVMRELLISIDNRRREVSKQGPDAAVRLLYAYLGRDLLVDDIKRSSTGKAHLEPRTDPSSLLDLIRFNAAFIDLPGSLRFQDFRSIKK